MVNIQNYLHNPTNVMTDSTNNPMDGKNLPLLNSLFVERFSVFNPYSTDNSFKTFMKWARKSPELMGFLNIIATDILSDAISFTPIKKESGRNKKLMAEKFWKETRGVEVAEETIYDLFINGIGYNWVGRVKDNELKEAVRKTLKELYPKMEKKELDAKVFRRTKFLTDESGPDTVKRLRHVAASTMTMHTNQYTVEKYVQRVGVNYKIFELEDIIEFRLMPFDGKVYPYPPMEGVLAQVYLLWLISQNYVSFFENGGKPDNVFILPKELAGSKNHTYLIDTLKKYKKIQNKHGNLVFTGDLNVEQLAKAEEQMQHKDLGLYLVGILAMMYGIPVSRIPFLVGKSASSGDSGGLADSGYWRRVSVWQSKLEDRYNQELFNPEFGVNMKFRRGYLQDEVRETQTRMQKVTIAQQTMGLGLWTEEKAAEYLDIDVEELEEAKAQKKLRDEEEQDMQMKMMNNKLESNGSVIDNPDKQLKNKKKKDTQNKNKTDNGGKTSNP